MNESAPVLESSASDRRDKIVPMIFFIGLLFMFLRPLLWNDVCAIRSGAQNAWLNFGADLLVFAALAATLTVIVMSRIGAIAYNTFREAVRNRILYFILLFALVLIGSSGIIRELAISAHDRIIRDLGITCVSFFGLMVAVFVGISLVYNELERKTIYTIVSKPVHRYQFLLGKYFGLLLTIYVIVGIMTVFFFAVVNYYTLTTDEKLIEAITEMRADGQRYYVANIAWTQTLFILKAMCVAAAKGAANVFGFLLSDPGVTPAILVVIAMTCLELMIVTAFAILYSSFSTPTLSAVFTVLTFVAGRLNEDIMRFAERILEKSVQNANATTISDLSWAVQAKVQLARIAALAVPNLDSLNVSEQVVYQGKVELWRYPALYALCYTICILSIAVLVFHRRNFK